MPEEIQTTVKVPVMEIIASLRKKHELPSKLTGVRLEGNNIVLNFADGGQEPIEIWEGNEPQKRKKVMEKVNTVNEEPPESDETVSEESPENEEAVDEEVMVTPEAMSEESSEDETARERNRFGKK